MKKQKVFYYSRSQDDEFITPPKIIKNITGDYVYIQHGFLHKLLAFICYRLIATPIAFVYTHLIKRIKIVNRHLLKPYQKDGYFIYANHTQVQADAFTPNVIVFPKRNYTIVSANNISLPLLGNATKLLGALPLPGDLSSGKQFIRAIQKRIAQGHSILIYPEAHIWPYYHKIRDFDNRSFKYPIQLGVPSFTLTTTYQKTKYGRCKIIVYVDGPFMAMPKHHAKDSQNDLHQMVISTMKQRAKLSTYIKYDYRQKEDT